MSSKTYKIEQVYDIASAFIEDKHTTFERAPDYGIGVTVYKLNKRITATLSYEMELCKTSSNSGFISLYRISMGKKVNLRKVFNAHALPRMLDFLRKRKFSTLIQMAQERDEGKLGLKSRTDDIFLMLDKFRER